MSKKKRYSVSLVYTKQEMGRLLSALRVIHNSAASSDEALGSAVVEFGKEDELKDFALQMKCVIEIKP